MRTSPRVARNATLGIFAALALAMLWWQYRRDIVSLGEPAVWTGYTLFGVIVFLFLFQSRKRLSMVPLGRAAQWTGLHTVGGLAAVALFWIHTGSLWPKGGYEQALAGLFYLVSISGVIGYGMLLIYPRRLTQRDVEVIYERIPNVIADARAAAEEVVLACTRDTGSDTLSRHYLETFHWFFQRPRFFFSHAVDADLADHWVRKQSSVVARYLDASERPYLEKLKEIAHFKTKIDFHYAVQTVMKAWLFVHVPLAAAMVMLAIWHLVLVNVYAL